MKNKYFTPQRITTFAMLAALGYVISLFSFSLFPSTAANFLKLDFSNVTTLLAGYMLGPVSAILVEAIKQALCCITSLTFGVGEIANFLITSSFVLVPSILYRFKKGIPSVLVGMSIGTALQICAALLFNRVLTYPIYCYVFREFLPSASELFKKTFGLLIAFNAIKAVSVCIITLPIYKRLSKAMKWLFRARKSVAKSDKKVYNIPMEKIVTKSAEETEKAAEEFARGFAGGETVLLVGDLGAGKTVFAKGVAKALGVKEDVKSPTFTLSCEYSGDKLRLLHIDAYRLKNGEEAEACGINERFGNADTVTLIEWPYQIESVLPKKYIKAEIARLSDNEREITFDVKQ